MGVRIIGLTGSIGMGKSTTGAMFRARGVPLHDADAAVHRLYRGKAVAPLEAAFPGVSIGGAVDRKRLADRVFGDDVALARLEAIVHPLVRESERDFLARSKEQGRALVVLDIPLLFEVGASDRVDVIVVVTADAGIQRDRVLARPEMDEQRLQAVLAHQVPDEEKRRRSHFLIDTGAGLRFAERQVDAVLRALAFTV